MKLRYSLTGTFPCIKYHCMVIIDQCQRWLVPWCWGLARWSSQKFNSYLIRHLIGWNKTRKLNWPIKIKYLMIRVAPNFFPMKLYSDARLEGWFPFQILKNELEPNLLRVGVGFVRHQIILNSYSLIKRFTRAVRLHQLVMHVANITGDLFGTSNSI